MFSYIVNAYWLNSTGSEKLINHIRENTNIDEIFYLSDNKIFENVVGQHLMFRLYKNKNRVNTTIKYAKDVNVPNASYIISEPMNYKEYIKNENELYSESKIDIENSPGSLLDKINLNTPLEIYGIIRQGIAENPASINNKTNDKYSNIFTVGEGVFTLKEDEIKKLKIPVTEQNILRPYHDLCDLDRYYINEKPSLKLIYSTRKTCPDINKYPTIKNHLIRFKKIMDERRETKSGGVKWWQLHWPRDEELWKTSKVLSLQMGRRPSFVPSKYPSYVSFSVNVLVPNKEYDYSLNYYSAILNSKLLWYW